MDEQETADPTRSTRRQGIVHEIGLRFAPDELTDEVSRAITAEA